jgi:hypothetical protein
MSDIVEDLRADLPFGCKEGMAEASANEIEALRCCNASLQTAFDEANEEVQRFGEQNRRLCAEVERLRDILLRMMLCQGQTTAQGTLMLVPPDVFRQAKEALGEKNGG